MANHLHRQIREAIVTKLTGLATTGANVVGSRDIVLDGNRLPGLRVYLDGETAQPLTLHANHIQERRLDVLVDACAKAVSGLENTLDQIKLEVEVALAAGITVGGKLLDVYYAGIRPDDDQQADKPAGVKTLQFLVPFFCPSTAPDTLAQ